MSNRRRLVSSMRQSSERLSLDRLIVGQDDFDFSSLDHLRIS